MLHERFGVHPVFYRSKKQYYRGFRACSNLPDYYYKNTAIDLFTLFFFRFAAIKTDTQQFNSETMKAIFKHLELAVEQEDVTQAKVILTYHKQKINLDYKDQRSGQTLLHKSCIQGSLSIIRLLVDQGASLEVQDINGNTAMHYACANGHFNVARFLLNNCANVYVRNYEGLQPVDLAEDSSLKMLVEMSMTLTSHENKVMTLGRIKKSKHTNQNPRFIHQTSGGFDSDGGGCGNTQNQHKAEEKQEFSNLRSIYDEKRILQDSREENNDTKFSYRIAKRSPLCRIRRGSLGVCKVKKINSFGKDSTAPARVNNLHHKLTEKKWSELQALRRVASETDIERLNEEQVNNVGGKMQKVMNTEEMNLVGLSISNESGC